MADWPDVYQVRDGKVEIKTCTWKSDSDGVHDTSCGNRFEFECDGPKVNGFKFCPYCGLRCAEK